MDFTPAIACRCCGSRQLRRVLDLGRQPLANSYTKEPDELPVYPLELVACPSCFHNQLGGVVNPDLMFRHYLYVSGTSRTLRDHFAEFAREVLTWVKPEPRRVLDLACNDGTLLGAFHLEGCSVAGVDPARNLADLANAKGLNVTEGYWPQARDAVDGSFDLITAANVIAHVGDPKAFLQSALDCLTPHGMVVLEFPYCREMILKREWDTIYHEHVSYFLAGPLITLAEAAGGYIARTRQVPIHGGSLRVGIQRGRGSHCQEVLELSRSEENDGLKDWCTYRKFAEHVDTTCRDLRELVDRLVREEHRVVGYGASAKGNTLLNRCPLPLAYIVDDNPLKHGYLTPGQQIPIKPPKQLLDEKPKLSILLLAWNFAREIVQNLKAWRPDRGDQVIHYVPRVFAHGVDADLPLLE